MKLRATSDILAQRDQIGHDGEADMGIIIGLLLEIRALLAVMAAPTLAITGKPIEFPPAYD